jgi:LysM repeat protein
VDYGIDVSHYNAVSDANAVRADGITYAWVKATEGADYVDPTFAPKVTQLRAAGIVVGAYHFADGSPVAAQAQHFRDVAVSAGCLVSGSLLPMLDMEDTTARAAANVIVPAFYDGVGVQPQDVYGNLDWWTNVFDRGAWGGRNLLGHIARYNGDPGSPGFTAPDLALHQHTDTGTVAGIPGAVDRDCTMTGYSLAACCIGGAVVVTAPIPTPPTSSASDTWTVQSGDTLARIASAWGVTVSAVAAANGITNPDLIYPGQVIHRPGSTGAAPAPTAGNTYTVRAGDTLSAIAAAHGTSVAELVTLNHVSNPDRITVGQVLTLPAATAQPVAVYVVKPGDTLGVIAARLHYPGGYVALAARNHISNPNRIAVGQLIYY